MLVSKPLYSKLQILLIQLIITLFFRYCTHIRFSLTSVHHETRVYWCGKMAVILQCSASMDTVLSLLGSASIRVNDEAIHPAKWVIAVVHLKIKTLLSMTRRASDSCRWPRQFSSQPVYEYLLTFKWSNFVQLFFYYLVLISYVAHPPCSLAIANKSYYTKLFEHCLSYDLHFSWITY